VTVSFITSNGSSDASGNISIGELSGVAGSSLYNDYWTIGAKNTDATFNGTITGDATTYAGSITKLGTGSWTLTGSNTYAGGTTVNGGSLIINNIAGSGTGTGTVTVNSTGTLAGTGIISGLVSIANGGTIAPGNNGIGTLIINNNLTLATGSSTSVEINKSSPANDTIRISGTITFNGTLSIVNTGLIPFAAGDNFQLFKASGFRGSFTSISPSTPATGLGWDTTTLRTSGRISIKGTQTINFGALAAKTYGDAPFDLSATSSSGLPVTYTSSDASVATISGTRLTILAPGNIVIKASQAGNSSYLPASDVTQNFTVNKASQIITFNPLVDKTYGDAPFNLTATGGASSNAVNFTSADNTIASITGTTVTIAAAGTTTITASQAGNANFNAAPDISQTLIVIKNNQTITFNDLTSKKAGDAPFNLTATSTSGLPVTYISSNLNVATINGSTITIVGPGVTTISASQSGNENYNAAPEVSKTLNITNTGITSIFGQDIVIAPNPVADILKVSFQIKDIGTTISIYSVNGVQLYNHQVTDKIMDIDMTQFQPGLYVIKIASPDGVMIRQIVKQ